GDGAGVPEDDAQLRPLRGYRRDRRMGREQREGGGRVRGLDDERRLALVAELLDRALGDDAAAVDDRDVVAGLLDLVEQVGREHDRAAVADECPDEAPELLDTGGIEPPPRPPPGQKPRRPGPAAGGGQAPGPPRPQGVSTRSRPGPPAPPP